MRRRIGVALLWSCGVVYVLAADTRLTARDKGPPGGATTSVTSEAYFDPAPPKGATKVDVVLYGKWTVDPAKYTPKEVTVYRAAYDPKTKTYTRNANSTATFALVKSAMDPNKGEYGFPSNGQQPAVPPYNRHVLNFPSVKSGEKLSFVATLYGTPAGGGKEKAITDSPYQDLIVP